MAHTNHRSLTDREHMFKCLKCGALTFLQSKHCICGAVEETDLEATELFNRRPAPENKAILKGSISTSLNKPLTLEQLRKMDGKPVWIARAGLACLHPQSRGDATMTNGERIRNMTDEELAEILAKSDIAEKIPFCKSLPECNAILYIGDETIPDELCQKCVVKWLEQEVFE